MARKISVLIFLIFLCSVALAQNSGGPDNFGYCYANNQTEEGTDYNWIDIAEDGDVISPITEESAVMILLPFSFPFYGVNNSAIYAADNGYLTFGTVRNAYENNSIPSNPDDDDPEDIIAVFWDDLTVTAGNGNVYTYHDTTNGENRFIIQYTDVPHWTSSGNHTDFYTFQAILYPSGEIVLQYQNLNGAKNSATIGIENADGTDGLEYAYDDDTFIYNELAVRFYVPEPIDNDLAISGFTGNITPSVGIENTYTISVTNNGEFVQSTYSINLLDEDDNVLGTVPGTLIMPGNTNTYDLTYTPAEPGEISLFAQVELDGEEIPEDNIKELEICQLEFYELMATLFYDDAEKMEFPINVNSRTSLSQTIYFPDEIQVNGPCTKLTLFTNFEEEINNRPLQIYMGETTNANLGITWVPVSEQTLVFDGTTDFLFGETQTEIELDTPFDYQNDNLVVTFYRPMDSVYFSSSNYFLSTNTHDEHPNRTRYYYSDGTNIDINMPFLGTKSDFMPNIAFEFENTYGGTISGVTKDDAESIIPNAMVTLHELDYTCTSDSMGNFEIASVPAGTYTMSAQVGEDYLSLVTQDILVEESSETPVEIIFEHIGINTMPQKFSAPYLANNSPNPFNPRTKIEYSVPQEGQVNLSIYNIKGQKVKTLVNNQRQQGKQEIYWNGTNDNGSAVMSGIYFYRLTTKNYSATKKMILLK